MARKITLTNEVLAVLSSMACDGNVARIPGGLKGNPLPRPLYEGLNKALEALGGKWNRKLGGHVFDVEAEGLIDGAVISRSVEDARKELQFFETPAEYARELVRMADIREGMHVQEPSCGQAAILMALPAHCHVQAVEVDPRRIAAMPKALPAFRSFTLHERDFLALPQEPFFDRVVMNPPFSKGRDVAHVRHAFGMLAPKGRLVSVMAGGITFREDSRSVAFRKFVDQHGGTIEPNPDQLFRSSGTDVSTVTVVMDRS